MTRVLNKAPIIEALCEFRFVPDTPWDWTIPGRVYERVQDDFPTVEQQPMVQFEVSQTPEGIVPNAQAGIERLRFRSASGTDLLQVGPDFFAVNHLAPYRGWPHFAPMIADNLAKYWDAAQPRAVQRIELRYINRIVLPEGKHHYEDFLNVYPQVPGGRDQVWGSWAQRVQIFHEELNAMLTFQAGTHQELAEPENQNSQSSIILDISFAPYVHHPLPHDAVRNWLEEAHQEIEKMFFQSVTKKCLELFEPAETEIS